MVLEFSEMRWNILWYPSQNSIEFAKNIFNVLNSEIF